MDGLLNKYHYALEHLSDKRPADWPLMSTPVPTYLMCLGYLLFVWLGPKYMKNRPAFDLRPLLLFYNFCLVLLSGYMTYEFLVTSVFNPKFSLVCQNMDYSDDPMAARLAAAVWWFFISKPIEFLDTVFFILRKKNSQVTFLHVYHHATMPMLWWIGTRFVPGGESYFSALFNSFVHTAMYTYYFLSALGPRVQPFLWWKRYLTKLQLLQFFAGLFHTVSTLFVNCGFPRPYMVALIVYLLTQISLFMNFYLQTYKKKSKREDHTNGVNGSINNNISSKRSKYD